jgi:predicted peroxiredoxin
LVTLSYFSLGARVGRTTLTTQPAYLEVIMTEQDKRQLVVCVTKGTDSEVSSVAFTIANGGLTTGLDVSMFLTSSAVDLVRKRAADTTHVLPLEPLKAMMEDFMRRGGTIWACTPCVKARGYEQADLMDGVVITGASLMHERLKGGATTLCF